MQKKSKRASIFGYTYDWLKTEYHLTAQDYSNALHHINLKYHVGNR